VHSSIRSVRADDRAKLLDIWLRSVRATHAFLTPDDVDSLTEPTRAYLTSEAPELWILADGDEEPVGFMGLAGSEVDALFLSPEAQGHGDGRRLIEHAARLRGELTVVVNEQNVGAVGFYEACGFVTERRADTDDEGRPFPILVMRRRRGSRDRG
jgi:putative acetyltransferase